jgi:hypothetical protein
MGVTRDIYNAPNVLVDPYYQLGDEQSRSELAIPLMVGNRLIGIFDGTATAIANVGRNKSRFISKRLSIPFLKHSRNFLELLLVGFPGGRLPVVLLRSHDNPGWKRAVEILKFFRVEPLHQIGIRSRIEYL